MSNTEWKECTIGDFVKIKHGFAFKGDNISTEDNGVVLVTPGNFAIGGGFQEHKCKFFTGEYPQAYVFKANDLVVTMTDLSKDGDTLGYSAIIPNSEKRIYLHNQRIGLVLFQNNDIEKDYLYWWMRSPSYQKSILATSSGSTVKHTSPDRICESKILVPSREKQKEIVKILSALDDKIELNNAINRNLEEQAQALFKNWFIDFEPFDGVIPEDWKIGTVADIAVSHDSKRVPLSGMQRESMKKIYPYYGATSLMDYVDNYIFDGIYLLLGEDGTVIDEEGFPILQYVEGKFWVNNHAHILTGKNGYSVEMLYLFFSLTNVREIVTGAVQPKISQGRLNGLPAIIPDKETIKKFDEIIQPLFHQIRLIRQENKNIASLRDILLPKLMYGELGA